MIISASRRTDIPAFYAEWFMNRIRAGGCDVPNPFNPRQVSRVSLRPEDVDVIVFWTRNACPLLPYLGELDHLGHRYCFLYTVVDHGRELEPGGPALEAALRTFRQIADAVGAARVVWRYDPIVFSDATGVAHHRETFGRIAGALAGHTTRCIISLVDLYAKVRKRLGSLGVREPTRSELDELIPSMVSTANAAGITLTSCAEEVDLATYGVRPGKCIDDEWIRQAFGIEVAYAKDPGQRKACRCVTSRDIGMYDTCPAGCVYCYATNDPERACARHAGHDPSGTRLVKVPECSRERERAGISGQP